MERKTRKTLPNSWFKKHSACADWYKWVLQRKDIGAFETIQELINIDMFDWVSWTLVRLMSRKQKIQYAIFAAELVLPIFEEKYPKDNRPRKAVEAAILVFKNNTQKNRDADYYTANSAAYDAQSAASDAYYDDYYAANSAAYVGAVAYDASNAAYYAAGAADKKETKLKIVNYGLSLVGCKREVK